MHFYFSTIFLATLVMLIFITSTLAISATTTDSLIGAAAGQPFLSTNPTATSTISTSNIISSSSQNFTCDNCVAYKALLIQCLDSIPHNASTTLNDVQLPLQRCLCNQTAFYEAFGNCETGCANNTIKSPDSFGSQCQLILSNNPPALPTPSSGTVLVDPYVSKLAVLPTTLNPTKIFGGATITANPNTNTTTPISSAGFMVKGSTAMWMMAFIIVEVISM